MTARIPRHAGATAAVFLTFSALSLFAAPRAELLPRWTANDPSATVSVDHSPWNDFLSRYLSPRSDGSGAGIAYAAVDPSDRESLSAYIRGLEAVRVSGLTRKEQFAFWVNLYNAVTVRLVLDHYPIGSIRDIRIGRRFGAGPWDARLVTVEGEALTLNDIEHGILRPIWKDPRIHYAVNCASLGCPDLRGEAFTADTAETLLEEGARDFVNSPRGVSFREGRLVLSRIYSWFEEDFGNGRQGLFDHLARYAVPEIAARLGAYGGRIRYEYDWNLNEP